MARSEGDAGKGQGGCVAIKRELIRFLWNFDLSPLRKAYSITAESPPCSRTYSICPPPRRALGSSAPSRRDVAPKSEAGGMGRITRAKEAAMPPSTPRSRAASTPGPEVSASALPPAQRCQSLLSPPMPAAPPPRSACVAVASSSSRRTLQPLRSSALSSTGSTNHRLKNSRTSGRRQSPSQNSSSSSFPERSVSNRFHIVDTIWARSSALGGLGEALSM
mmetsp:Transcript_16891/g.53543  ORF Transcript_16891/g.53543 Transcript_16891/m.53543 type:complete len:220 (+) Transcript_16891:2558-3217(+)